MCLFVFLRHQLKLSEPFNQSACCFKGVAKIVVATLPYRCHGKLLVCTGCLLVRTALRRFVRHLTSKHCSVDNIVMEAKQANKETNRPKKHKLMGELPMHFPCKSSSIFGWYWRNESLATTPWCCFHGQLATFLVATCRLISFGELLHLTVGDATALEIDSVAIGN